MPEIKEEESKLPETFHQEYNHKNDLTFITILLTVHVDYIFDYLLGLDFAA